MERDDTIGDWCLATLRSTAGHEMYAVNLAAVCQVRAANAGAKRAIYQKQIGALLRPDPRFVCRDTPHGLIIGLSAR
jgi:hypothetical protein